VKNYLWPETGTGGGLIDPLGAEDEKRTGGGENLAEGFNPPPINSRPVCFIVRLFYNFFCFRLLADLNIHELVLLNMLYY